MFVFLFLSEKFKNFGTLLEVDLHILAHLQRDAAITIPELTNDKVYVFEQYPCREKHKITQNEFLSLDCLWVWMLTGKLQTLIIPK